MAHPMQASSSTKKRFATRLILVGASLFVAFLCVELFTRTFLRALQEVGAMPLHGALGLTPRPAHT